MPLELGVTFYTTSVVSLLIQIRKTILHTGQRQRDRMIESTYLYNIFLALVAFYNILTNQNVIVVSSYNYK